jgi:hypothetical protein
MNAHLSGSRNTYFKAVNSGDSKRMSEYKLNGALVPSVSNIPIIDIAKKNSTIEFLFKSKEEKTSIGGTKLAINQTGYKMEV